MIVGILKMSLYGIAEGTAIMSNTPFAGKKNSNFRYLRTSFYFFRYKFQLVPSKYEPGKQNESFSAAVLFEIIFPPLIRQVKTCTKNFRIYQTGVRSR